MALCGGMRAPPFIVTPATGGPTALVFASPHSGAAYPDDLNADPGLSEASLRSAEDLWVDRLVACGPAHGAPLIAGGVGRAYLDLNRAPEDLDPLLIPGVEGAPSLKVKAGYGVVPRLTGDGRPLYRRTLTSEEAKRRIARVHAPYHAALGELMGAAREATGRAVLVDWHSMPDRAAGGLDVVVGDRHGASCSAALSRRLRTLFEASGWRVALNHPYPGGYATELWGRPAERFEAVQVELRRGLYWTGEAEPGAAFHRCRRTLERVITALANEVAAR
jgi:N-formylglutamate amidohydrolase